MSELKPRLPEHPEPDIVVAEDGSEIVVDPRNPRRAFWRRGKKSPRADDVGTRATKGSNYKIDGVER